MRCLLHRHRYHGQFGGVTGTVALGTREVVAVLRTSQPAEVVGSAFVLGLHVEL